MNLRIKKLRKKLNMTQEEFSSKIGLSRNFIAQIESGAKKPSDRTISSICREFNVNETWLRSGIGDMNVSIKNNAISTISEIIDKNNPLYNSISKIMISYQQLDADSRSVIDHLIDVLISKQNLKANTFPITDPALSIDEKVALYRKKLEQEEKTKGSQES